MEENGVGYEVEGFLEEFEIGEKGKMKYEMLSCLFVQSSLVTSMFIVVYFYFY